MNKESLIRQLNIVKNGFNKSIDIVIKELEKSKNKEKDKDIPLTLKQMEEMLYEYNKPNIGVHIWVENEDKTRIAAILDSCEKYGICAIYSAGGVFFTESNYGTKWLAYRV